MKISPDGVNWTLNEQHGYYVRTGIKVETLHLRLACRAVDGRVCEVGTFDLDLLALARAGFVTLRRSVSGNVFDVRIEKDPVGVYWLSGPKGHKQKLQ